MSFVGNHRQSHQRVQNFSTFVQSIYSSLYWFPGDFFATFLILCTLKGLFKILVDFECCFRTLDHEIDWFNWVRKTNLNRTLTQISLVRLCWITDAVRVVTPGLVDNVCFAEHLAQREGICSFADIKQLTILRFSFRIIFIPIRYVATIAMKAFQWWSLLKIPFKHCDFQLVSAKRQCSWRLFIPLADSIVGFSRRSDSRAREKNSRRKKKRGKIRGGKGERTVPPPRFPGVQFNSPPTYRRALLSERLEQANSIAYL